MVEQAYLRLTDAVFARLPQPTPAEDVLKGARIVSHRGEHDNVTVMENTLAAFDRAGREGIWGVELDVRWSADLKPVVVHDADLQRLHGLPEQVGRLTREQLRQRVPRIPFLEEVVERFGSRLHLMIEIKEPVWRAPARQCLILKEILSGLTPMEHYHFMALQPAILTPMTGFPPESCLAIAYHWPDRFSRWALAHLWGGLCAHYSLLRRSHIEKHHARGQKVGTAYPCSRRSLYRELNRGVDWIFSNHAARLQEILNGHEHQTSLHGKEMP
jgi:glycerophosphoryl diester phosphodiesterase